MLVAPLIERKRDGGALTPDEWHALVDGFTAGDVPDYQMSALCMAVTWRGMTPEELAALTHAMRHSGAQLAWPGLGRPVVDKHSTGGVGDKVSLLLAPLLACCGVAVPMMSGRGLGHTGGTVDKLEAIPGFRVRLSLAEAVAQVRRLGVAMLAPTKGLAPADGKLYALRDVTGTVASVPLIAASIMAKKLAEGLDALVLDVKRGSGAFLPDDARALELARTMVGLGEAHGCRTVALVTAMDRPLGHACGNALEVEEAIAGLSGEGPPDVTAVTLALGEELLLAARAQPDRAAARAALEAALASGAGLEVFRRLVEAQGGNPHVVEDPALLPQAPVQAVHVAPADGVVAAVHPRPVGLGVIELGGGRRRVEDAVDPAVGFVITARPGQAVRRGEPLATIHARDEAGLAAGRRALGAAIVVGPHAGAAPLPLVSHRIDINGTEALA
jgi:pyrimidine-nucleoside phosphorylase